MTASTSSNKKTQKTFTTKQRILAIGLAILVWQAFAMLLNNHLILVTPIDVVVRLSSLLREVDFWKIVIFSLSRIICGFLLAFLVGTILAVLSCASKWFELFLWPYMSAVKATPVVSFIILCLIWLNSDTLSIFVSFLIVLPIIYANVYYGIKSVDNQLLEMAKVYNMSTSRKLVYIYLPHLKPYIMSMSSVAFAMAWKSGIAAEVIGLPTGSIGDKLYQAKVYFSSPDLFAWTVVIITLSVLCEKLFLILLEMFYKLPERRQHVRY